MNKKWKVVIEPEARLFDFKLKEIWNYRDLCIMFVKKNYITRYKQTVLGPLYMVLQPLLTSGIFSVVFGAIAGVSTDGVPDFLFYMAGNLGWLLFSGCVTENSNTFVGNAYIMGKVYFPRLIIPMANTITKILNVALQFLLFILFDLVFWYMGDGVNPNVWILITPFLLFMLGIMGLGIGLIVSSLTVKYRDLSVMLGFIMNMAMYVTPVIYPVSSIDGVWGRLVMINPVAPIIEAFRYAFFGVGVFSLPGILWGTAFTLVVWVLGTVLFNKVEKNFIDTI